MSNDVDWTKTIYGEHARHVPAWVWIQDGMEGVVAFAGGSRMHEGTKPHPLMYGTPHTHHFMLGELVFRPHIIIGTNHYIGTGLTGLLTSGESLHEIIANGGEIIMDTLGVGKGNKI